MPLLEDPTGLKQITKVAYTCDGCGKPGSCEVRRIKNPILCRMCAVSRPQTAEHVAKRLATAKGTGPARIAKIVSNLQDKYVVSNVSQLPEVRAKKRRPAALDVVGVLRDETVQRYGYTPSELPRTSDQPVMCQCQSCANTFHRVRRNVKAPLRCQRCSIRKGRPLETVQVYTCADCGDISKTERCRDCRHKLWWAQRRATAPVKIFVLNSELPILELATLDRHGYLASSVSPNSHTPVVVECPRCLQEFSRVRRNVRAPVLCASCSHYLWWQEHHDACMDKRIETTHARYPDGLPSANGVFGGVVDDLKAELARMGGVATPKERLLSKSLKRLDVYYPALNLAIEYTGFRRHNEASKTPRLSDYHKLKLDMATRDGIRLITLFEDEWLHRRDQVLGVLRNIFDYCTQKVHGRKCRVALLDGARAKAFINQHHLQPLHNRPKAAWGIFYQDRLCGVMSVRHSYVVNEKDVLVLNRLCFASGVRIRGGAAKLFKELKLWAVANGYHTVITQSDNRWTTGNVYIALGFQHHKDAPPEYSYVKAASPKAKRYPKKSLCKARTGCPANVEEWKWNLDQLGYARIWDCGHKIWSYSLT